MILEQFFYLHKKAIEDVSLHFKRYLYHNIDWDKSNICITGARGVGKTTTLLQHYHEKYHDVEKCLYISADNIEVSAVGLFNIAKEYFTYGGLAMIIDEIHKYPAWQVELKNIIDTFKNKRIFISGSSSLNLQEGKIDLSRRLVYYNLAGLSFREYLKLKENIELPIYKLEDLLAKHTHIAQNLKTKKSILKCFNNYLVSGYYPFFLESETSYLLKLLNVIEKVLYEDIATISNIKKSNIIPLKKFLWLITTSSPFYVNIEKISRELKISKEYVYAYLEYLEGAKLITTLRSDKEGYKFVRKPEKVLIENTNLLIALNNQLRFQNNQGTVRETFFVNQLKNVAKISLCEKGDFLVDDKYIFEIGGKNKDFEQIKDLKNSYVATDRIEIGARNKIPLYMFGLLY